MLMKKGIFCSLFVLMMLAGCAGSQQKASPELFSRMKRIIIVPVGIPAPALTSRASVDGWVFLGSTYPPEAEADLALLSGALSVFSRDLRNGKTKTSIDPSLAVRQEPWNPSVTLAKEAATLISSSLPYEVFVKEQHTLRVPPQENPRSRLDEWYHQNFSALDMEELKRAGMSAALEVGLAKYELLQDQLLLQILVKIIDASSGEVKARSKTHALVKVDSPEALFIHGGEKFKTVFASEGRRLLAKNLQDIGMLHP
jgi:hypothetical protein